VKTVSGKGDVEQVACRARAWPILSPMGTLRRQNRPAHPV